MKHQSQVQYEHYTFIYCSTQRQGLIEPKQQEGMQLNVNRQMAKCKVLLKINRHTRTFTRVNGYGLFYSKNLKRY